MGLLGELKKSRKQNKRTEKNSLDHNMPVRKYVQKNVHLLSFISVLKLEFDIFVFKCLFTQISRYLQLFNNSFENG